MNIQDGFIAWCSITKFFFQDEKFGHQNSDAEYFEEGVRIMKREGKVNFKIPNFTKSLCKQPPKYEVKKEHRPSPPRLTSIADVSSPVIDTDVEMECPPPPRFPSYHDSYEAPEPSASMVSTAEAATETIEEAFAESHPYSILEDLIKNEDIHKYIAEDRDYQEILLQTTGVLVEKILRCSHKDQSYYQEYPKELDKIHAHALKTAGHLKNVRPFTE